MKEGSLVRLHANVAQVWVSSALGHNEQIPLPDAQFQFPSLVWYHAT